MQVSFINRGVTSNDETPLTLQVAPDGQEDAEGRRLDVVVLRVQQQGGPLLLQGPPQVAVGEQPAAPDGLRVDGCGIVEARRNSLNLVGELCALWRSGDDAQEQGAVPQQVGLPGAGGQGVTD